MATFQVNYSIDGRNGDLDFDATDLNEAFVIMVKNLHDEGITQNLLADTAVKVKNLESGEEFVPNFEQARLVPVMENSAVE